MKNLGIWITSLLAIIVLFIGIIYYGILDFVVKPTSFILTLIIILVILLLAILSTTKKNK